MPPGPRSEPSRRGAGATGRAGRSGGAGGAGQRGQGRQLGGEQVEGRRAVRELLAAGRRPVREVWMAAGVDDAPVLTEITRLAEANRVPVRIVSRSRLDDTARTDAPQGVLARAGPLAEAELATLVTPAAGRPPPFLLVLDGVTDPHNLGALVRSAECAGATGLIVSRHRSALVTPTVTKAAAGAIEYLPVAVVPGIPAALSALATAGVWTVGLDAGASQPLWDLELVTEPIALVLGGEGRGLSRLVRERCDHLVAIPQRGRVASLNVAAAGALACFEVARRRR